MAEEEQQFHEEEQYDEDGMEADGAGEEGHEEATDVSGPAVLPVSDAYCIVLVDMGQFMRVLPRPTSSPDHCPHYAAAVTQLGGRSPLALPSAMHHG
jgi:hypothetical protein